MSDQTVGIVDYGCGNLFSVTVALKRLGVSFLISRDKKELSECDGIIVPGVGSFPTAMNNLTERGLVPVIKQIASDGKPVLGVCLGMQILLEEGLEGEITEGLGLVSGKVIPIKKKENLRIPHIGWNDISDVKGESEIVTSDMIEQSYYFVHSYHASLNESIPSAYVQYGDENLVAAFQKENVIGCQFHPEKSQDAGMLILKKYQDMLFSYA